MRPGVGVRAHHHLEPGRVQRHSEHRAAEGVSPFHRRKAFFGIVAQAQKAGLLLKIVWKVEADVGIEPDSVLSQQG